MKGHSVQKLQRKRADRRTGGADCISSCAKAVRNEEINIINAHNGQHLAEVESEAKTHDYIHSFARSVNNSLSLVNSGVTKFLNVGHRAVIAISAMQSPNPMWNASATNEGAVCQILPVRPQSWFLYRCPLSNHKTNFGLIISVYMYTNPEILKIGPSTF